MKKKLRTLEETQNLIEKIVEIKFKGSRYQLNLELILQDAQIIEIAMIQAKNISHMTITPPLACNSKRFKELEALVEEKLTKRDEPLIMEADSLPDFEKILTA